MSLKNLALTSIAAVGLGMVPFVAHAGTVTKIVECTSPGGYDVSIYESFDARIGLPDDQQTHYSADVTAPNGEQSSYDDLAPTSRIAGQEVLAGAGFELSIRVNSTRDRDGGQQGELRATLASRDSVVTALSCRQVPGAF